MFCDRIFLRGKMLHTRRRPAHSAARFRKRAIAVKPENPETGMPPTIKHSAIIPHFEISRNKSMPFYEYQCTNCGHKLEALQKISDKPLTQCPNCEMATLKKLVTAAAFRLKGSGWYETDFKNSGKKKTDKSGKDTPDPVSTESGKDSTDKKGKPAESVTSAA